MNGNGHTGKQLIMKYKVEINHCNCHPETCCCRKYRIVNSNGEVFTTENDLDKADKIAEALNK